MALKQEVRQSLSAAGRRIASNTEQHLEWARHLRAVDHLTMAEITAKTGIPRTSLYRHFNQMDDRAVSAGSSRTRYPEARVSALHRQPPALTLTTVPILPTPGVRVIPSR